jgi:Spy/CpxP family protein refolding chaperone
MLANRKRVVALGAGLGVLFICQARAQETRTSFRPELEQLAESVSERLSALADELGLTDEQKKQIREADQSSAAKLKAALQERRELLRKELEAVGSILTPEQKKMAQELIEDKQEQGWEDRPAQGMRARYSANRDTLAERLQAAADKLGLTEEQREKIRQACAQFAQQHRQNREARRALVEAEFQQIAKALTPEQREKARRAISERVVLAVCTQRLADRLEDAADTLKLTDEQRQKIRKQVEASASQFEQAREERQALLHKELKAISEILTPEQRQQVRDFCHDRVVVIKLDVDALRDPQVREMLKETVAERVEAAADALKLTDDQRQKIREKSKEFMAEYKAQREKREQMRRAELEAISAILTPQQRQQVQDFVSEKLAAKA